MIKKSAYLGVFILCLIGIIACEEDFKDVNSGIIPNEEFSTSQEIIYPSFENVQVKTVRADGIEIGKLGQILLGVYNNSDYEKIEASFVSRITLPANLKLLSKTYDSDTIVVSTLDTAFVKLPYQATSHLDDDTDEVSFTLDSIIGVRNEPFTLNIYKSTTYLNILDHQDPTKTRQYLSNAIYGKDMSVGELNDQVDYQFIPSAIDTIFYAKRRLNNGNLYDIDTIKLTNKNPFARIPLNKTKMKELFLEKYDDAEFQNQEEFNNYFRGLYLEATGNTGSLIGFNVNGSNSSPELNPSIEVYYTNTVYEPGNTTPIDTIKRHHSFQFSNFTNSIYKMENGSDKVYPQNNNVIIQGTAGNEAVIDLFGADADNNGIADKLEELRSQDILINDAILTVYVNQDIVQYDTIATPFRLYLYKIGEDNHKSQIKDVFTEGMDVFGGNLQVSEDKPNKYVFRISDYISDLITNKTNYNPLLGLKVYNPTDIPTSVIDTIIEPYSWNPKAVTLLNKNETNGDRKIEFKIMYSKRKD